MAKAPAFQFYPGDWLRDTALRACSLPARGLWIDMLCIMHQGEPYGHMTIKGSPIDNSQLTRMVGGTPKDVASRLAELEAAGVFSRTDAGTIFSRRMVEDERIRRARADGGKLGGNPALKDNHKVNGKVNLTPNLQPTPSSSSSSSSSTSSSDVDVDGAKEIPLSEGIERVLLRCKRIAKFVKCGEGHDKNWDTVAKVAVLWDEGAISEDVMVQVLESFDAKREKGERIGNGAAWFVRCLQNQLSQHGQNLNQMLLTTTIPIGLLVLRNQEQPA